MKKRLFSFATLLVCAAAAAAPVTITNGNITLAYDNGVVHLTAPDSDKPAAAMTTGLKTATLKASVLSHPARKFQLLSLRGPDGSIAFKIEDDSPRFTVTYNRNASPVTVKWNAAAVVVPDVFAEDEVLLPQSDARDLPPFVPLYLALLEGGDATLACIPIKAKSPAVLSGDLRTLTINSKNNEDYVFVLNAAKGAWRLTDLPAKPEEFRDVADWRPPYPAVWVAALPVEKDFIGAGDGAWSVWNIITVTGKGRPKNLPVRATMVNKETRRNWFGGFEGTFRYPVEFVDGKVKLMHPRFNNKIVHDLKRHVYIYAWRGGQKSEAALPEKFLPPWVAANQIHRSTNTNYGMLATTCNVTQQFEKLFYRDEAEEKLNELAAMLKSMQCFVENIRGRIESGREWRTEMLEFSAGMRKLRPELAPDAAKLDAVVNEIDRLYQLGREKIKTPPEVEAMEHEVLKLATSKLDAEEKEEQAKKLGRAIRTVGGTQDNMIAKFRHVGKCLRHVALTEYMAAKTPAAKEFWKEAYTRTESLLQGFLCDGK